MGPFAGGETALRMTGEDHLKRARAGAIPTGTVTFLFTDIEGSTRRWDADSAAMTQALMRHDGLARTAVERCGGHIFKTVGDGFLCAFTDPTDALQASIDFARSIAAADFAAVGGLDVRIALHTGLAEERDDDYFGPTLNRAARLLSTAHGGQIILSGATHDALATPQNSGAAFKDLGVHRLKDLTRPERVYQLVVADLRADFPPLRSLTALPNNLPSYLTSFVGREREVNEIAALLDANRLVTLVGSGGIGKTRTSLQVAANLLDGSGDGVWFIELAPVSSGEYMPRAVATAFGLTLPPEGDPLDHLVRALASKGALVILDNCEHLVEPVARVVAALLRGCPKLKIVASSRQSLGISGERTYRLPSLELPAADALSRLRARDALRWSAIVLFVDRARATDTRFVLTDKNAPAVADICSRLDGIPFALELAAARVKMLSPRQLRERLDQRFRLLTGGNRGALPRQQTLRALIDWSHDLLDERERTVFRRLGIFVNGFSLEGALAVGSGEDGSDPDTFDALASLVDKSLVLAEPVGDQTRYRLLETTRAYACEKLAAADETQACAHRHLRYFRDRLAEARESWLRTAISLQSQDLLALELEDVRGALDRALGTADNSLGADLLTQTLQSWERLSLSDECLTRIAAFLAVVPAHEFNLLARLTLLASLISANTGQHVRAYEAGTRAAAFARRCDDSTTLGEALFTYSICAARLRKFDDAQAALAESDAIANLPAAVRLRLLSARALVSLSVGDFATAARAYEQLRKEFRALGNEGAETVMTLNLAETEHARGCTARAIALARASLPAARSAGGGQVLVTLLGNLAGYLCAIGNFTDACEAAREAIAELASRESDSPRVEVAIEHLALGLALGGTLELAATLASYSDAALRRRGYARSYTETTTRDRLTALLSERLSQDQLARIDTEGAVLTTQAAVSRALTAKVAMRQ
jgi:predicted ATPase/class 3 adenylate cyclase